MGDTEIIVRAQDLQKRYETLTAVDHVTFEIRRGEIFGLLGPNGAARQRPSVCWQGCCPRPPGRSK